MTGAKGAAKKGVPFANAYGKPDNAGYESVHWTIAQKDRPGVGQPKLWDLQCRIPGYYSVEAQVTVTSNVSFNSLVRSKIWSGGKDISQIYTKSGSGTTRTTDVMKVAKFRWNKGDVLGVQTRVSWGGANLTWTGGHITLKYLGKT
ncbi:hypothetical protein ACFY2H_00455 [Streptomyces griseofuscus]|uniref:hypothetical protein n=1 Tax=Streptomyces griseofuscus TaxID=146922 RepID=UPI0036AB7318